MARILLVEDHIESREVMAQMLTMHGHTVDQAESGEAAWEQMKRQMPEAVVVDLHLPGMTGVALLERIRGTREWAGVSVIICSGDDSQRDAALLAGAADFWVKGSEGIFAAIRKLGDQLGRDRRPGPGST